MICSDISKIKLNHFYCKKIYESSIKYQKICEVNEKPSKIIKFDAKNIRIVMKITETINYIIIYVLKK